jgi:long-chain acyl-CoA synthetase
MNRFFSLHDLISALPQHKDRPAIVALQKEGLDVWSYRKLSEHVVRLAAGLAEAGLCRGGRVAILAGNSPEWVVACLAVVQTGGVAVPLDVQLNANALHQLLQDSGVRSVFTTRGNLQRLQTVWSDLRLTPILLDSGPSDPRGWRCMLVAGTKAWQKPAPEEVATLFYTSGTTGSFKGVPLSHRNLVFQLNAIIAANLLSDADCLLLPLPLHHAYPFAIGMLLPLAMGLPIVMPQALTGPQMMRAIREGAVTTVVGAPRLFEALYSGIETRLESGGRIAALLFKANLNLNLRLRRWLGLRAGKLLLRPLHQQVGPRLRIMACGGAQLDLELAWKLEAIGWQVAIGYGLTETSPLLTLNPPGTAKIGTVGKPIPGVELRIDSSGPRPGLAQERTVAPQLKHASGEILARGPNVFAAYRNLPERTAEAFTSDGWFRTGDLGFFDQEGYLHLTGRLSTLIVTAGGEKVQPDEVEEAYGEAAIISEIGVLQEDGKLVAVIVPKLSEVHAGKEEAVGQAIREAVQRVSERLPSYQRISDFVLTRDSLARTRLGKIRRHLLAERYEQEKTRRDGTVNLGTMSLEEMPSEDLALLEDAAAKKVWDLLVQRYAAKRLSLGASPQLDLGVDSLEWLNLTLEIPWRAGVELSDQAIGRIATVRDLLREVSEAGTGVRAASLLEDPKQVLNAEQKRWLKPRGAITSAAVAGLYALNWVLVRAWFRLQVKGLTHLPEKQPFVLIPNHLSYLDPQVIAAALRFRQLRRTYWGVMTTNPFIGVFRRLGQIVPIDPDRALISSLAFGAAVLKHGNHLVWFAEGALSPTGELQPFKPGIGILLERFQTLAVPVAIHGTDRALPIGKLWPRPKLVTVEFGQPLNPHHLEQQGKGNRPHERILEALHEQLAVLQNSSAAQSSQPHFGQR